jgi:hypothetical protein
MKKKVEAVSRRPGSTPKPSLLVFGGKSTVTQPSFQPSYQPGAPQSQISGLGVLIGRRVSSQPDHPANFEDL